MALSDYQISFNGLTIGSGTTYPLLSIDGLEEFTARSTDVVMPNAYGALAGPAWVEERFVTVVIEVLGGPPVVHALENALQPNSASPDVLTTLGVKLPDREELALQARVDRRSRPMTNRTEFGRVEMTVMFAVPDPRKYSAATYTSSMAAYVSTMNGITLTLSSGTNLAINMTAGSGTNLGLDFPANTTTGDYTINNAGNTTTYPTFTITTTGTASTYTITNLTTGDVVSLSQAINVFDTLIVNMAAAVTGVGTPVVYDGTSKYSVWQTPRIPLRLIPGNNVLRFVVTSGSTSSTAVCTWQNAYL